MEINPKQYRDNHPEDGSRAWWDVIAEPEVVEAWLFERKAMESELICAVCGEEGRKWRGIKRPLCEKCRDAARAYSKQASYGDGYHEGFTSPPKDISVPLDGNYDPYTGKNRRLEE
jgi:hypothetical protein